MFYRFRFNVYLPLRNIRALIVSFHIILRYSLLFIFSAALITPDIYAQVQGTDREHIFQEDDERVQASQQKRFEELLKVDNTSSDEIDFTAPTIEYDKDTKEIKGSGGVILAREGVQLQCDTAYYNQETQDVRVEGQLLFTWPQGRISAAKGDFSLKTETGEFEGSEIVLDDSLFRVRSHKLYKDSETEYRLYDAGFSTCDCADGGWPWSIDCDKATIEEDAYAHTYDTTIDMYGIPIFYSPYFFFPVKDERQSGLLPPTFGYSKRDGAQLRQPIYLVLDDHSDLTVSPFIETRTRFGAQFDYRAAFSRYNQVESKFIYSDDSARDGELRGTNVSGLDDPTFDDERYGIYYKQRWQTETGAMFPTSMVADIHYVSDDLFLREFDEEDIGKRSARYTTSRVLVATAWHQYLSSEISGEFNQALESDDDLVFQRLPEVQLVGSKTFRPFGFNPYGFKLVTNTTGTATLFERDEGFDGWRYDLSPEVKIPHHYRNILNAELSLKYNQTYYDLRNLNQPNSDDIVEENDRGVLTGQYKVGTAVERVYEVPEDSFLKLITSIGSENQDERLRRVKHVIEPSVSYTYIPDEDQDLNPFFDSLDRIRERSLFSFGVKTSLLGRFLPRYVGGEDLTELTPDIEDLPSIETKTPLPLTAESSQAEIDVGRSVVRKGEIREIATFGIRQSYDHLEDRDNQDPNRAPWSDIALDLGLYPTPNFGLRFTSNVDPRSLTQSSWSLASHLKDDRGDVIRARYTFVDNSISQLDGNVELVLDEQLKFGVYSRFDERDSEFIESKAAFRFRNACKCWGLDVGIADTANPDRQQVFLALNFNGLGALTQKFNNNPNQ